MLNDLMGKFQEAQNQMEAAKKKLNEKFVEVEIEGGQIKVQANGNKKITNITINPALFEDKEALEDLLITAVNKATEKAEDLFNTEMQGIAGGMLGGMNGLF